MARAKATSSHDQKSLGDPKSISIEALCKRTLRLCIVTKDRVYHDIISVEMVEQAQRGDWGGYKHAVEAVTKAGARWLYLYDSAAHATEDFEEWRDTESPKCISLTIDGEKK